MWKKISVNESVKKEMEKLRNERSLTLNVTTVYDLDQISFKFCYLNARSLHKHIDDVRHDLNYTSTDINIFSETRFQSSDDDSMYLIDGYTLFRNELITCVNVRTVQRRSIFK